MREKKMRGRCLVALITMPTHPVLAEDVGATGVPDLKEKEYPKEAGEDPDHGVKEMVYHQESTDV